MLAWLIACGPGDFVDGASLSVPAGAEQTAALAIPALPTVPLARPTLPQGTDLAQCYVRVDGTAVCIGFDDAHGQLSPPPGVYVAAAGRLHRHGSGRQDRVRHPHQRRRSVLGRQHEAPRRAARGRVRRAAKDCRDLQALLRVAPSPADRTRACEQFTTLMATIPNAPAGCQ